MSLRLAGIRARRGDRLVLDGVDLELGPGELGRIVGANGSGKSTLLRVAARLHPAEGSVSAGRVGWMGEPGPLRRSVDQLLALIVSVHGRGDPAGVRARMALPAGGVDALSAGQRRRVLLAAALVHEPDVLLLDEPLTHLDPAGQAELLRIVAEERARGAAVLVATHFPDRFAPDRAWTLSDGRLS